VLAADSLFGGNTMDGKFKLFTLGDLESQGVLGSSLQEGLYVEVPYGVTAIENVTLGASSQ
jgi:hypothetical protein